MGGGVYGRKLHSRGEASGLPMSAVKHTHPDTYHLSLRANRGTPITPSTRWRRSQSARSFKSVNRLIYNRLNNSAFLLAYSCSLKTPRLCRVASFSMLAKISVSPPVAAIELLAGAKLFWLFWLLLLL